MARVSKVCGEHFMLTTVNSDSSNPLIYDFYGFPKHYYSQTFVSYGDDVLLGKIRGALKSGGIAFEEEKRGLDHGVWGMSRHWQC